MWVFKKRVSLRWINKRRRERSKEKRSQPSHIPIDLTLEILSRLPAKINRRPRLLLTVSSGGKKYGLLLPQHQNPDRHKLAPQVYLLPFSPRYKLAPQVYPTPAQHLGSTWSLPLCMPPGSLSDTHYLSNYFNDYIKT
ncbi:hypothetical protein DY000_02047204 [Brassica cretica]|uniref:F-box domain-containing protein n=1 Tax=Brassica cretica TaxID=69181 RepID=A0ABQ7EVT3_BRACR|nr:hypothetical protein DY000_02047204 [Brassica cretica]